jgi:hypothetical protein
VAQAAPRRCGLQDEFDIIMLIGSLLWVSIDDAGIVLFS